MRQRDLIRDEYRDSDGYWITLIHGYQYDGRHTIHESTKRDALACLRDVETCQCEQCKAQPV